MGREPDQYRYDFDKPRADSWAGCLNRNPTPTLALQVSHTYIKSPKDLHPDENVYRTTASVLRSRSWGRRHSLASALVWGLNRGTGHSPEHTVDAGDLEQAQGVGSHLGMPRWAFGDTLRS